MKLLHLDASALGAYSVSRGLTAAIVAEFVQNHPGVDVTYRDLHAAPLGHWGLPAGENDPVAAENAAVLEEFLAADVVVIGSPMYNFSITSSLKAWIDRITVAGKTFQYTANGPEGLAGGKRVIIASSRGGVYSQGAPAAGMDFQEPYLRAIFGFLGVTDIEFVRAEGVAMSDDHKAQAVGGAIASIGSVIRKAA
ncbi:FMN-dependent NADH-azoreductase [Luteibacter rhizovicinus DSM 16549]|uniref:FMN dependent NADH:quinone oxidoreductase n=1 Tax=Luteibacter rhizovicinus DSM 16549 TaxID=1440763 RepID=A0A0G9HAU9_9GAMM|nr:FMN-dependent NADH-azoreductase [Luteibacter rhizovicinus]APG05763.1 FMN-dependent NADH-azoreductase [Luteibacter rhizovicinus DSM 16549]KLD66733.1 FMN-dependent NADH-azoreductase [Luteibacter rhizovicinus DSM 16549]KLD75390.1 FMN-dependent NADH-azoreductase [Xanthomonas hyacinthi DSM 19077]